jgi:hypothetical protein
MYSSASSFTGAGRACRYATTRSDDGPSVVPGNRGPSAVQTTPVRFFSFNHGATCCGADDCDVPISLAVFLADTQVQTTARYAHLAADPIKDDANHVSAEIATLLDGRTAWLEREELPTNSLCVVGRVAAKRRVVAWSPGERPAPSPLRCLRRDLDPAGPVARCAWLRGESGHRQSARFTKGNGRKRATQDLRFRRRLRACYLSLRAKQYGR